MKITFIVLLSLLVGLYSCAAMQSIGNGNSVASQIPGVITLNTEKSLIVVHLAYNALGEELIIAARANVLRGSNASLAKNYYSKAGDALIVADKADAAANEKGVINAVTAATDAIFSAKALLKGN